MKITDITKIIPKMKTGNDLILALETLPKYNKSICNKGIGERLMALSDLYSIYIPSDMSVEIYNKLYIALLQSLKKKNTQLSIIQSYENHKAVLHQEYKGIMGGTDSFTIIGLSGIGKSSAISRAISLISKKAILEFNNPYNKIIPCIVVQCPFDSSVKGLLLEILRKVDELLQSKYYEYAIKRKITVDMLIGCVSQVSINHIGLLIVDEIQNVCNSKNGKNLVGMLTQLINNSGISIGMVGTPECSGFFEQEMQLARRSLGLKYGSMKYDMHFRQFCEKLFSYKYIKKEAILSDSIIEWLYEHSGGIASVVVSLIHDAQEIAIMTGSETLDINTLNAAYQKRLSFLHDYVKTSPIKYSTTSIKQKALQKYKSVEESSFAKTISLAELFTLSKKNNLDLFQLLKDNIAVEEVSL